MSSIEASERTGAKPGVVIVWESGDLVVGRTRRVFDRAGVSPVRVATPRDCLRALRAAQSAAVLIEVSPETASETLFGVWAIQASFPRAAALVALHRGAEPWEAAFREWSAIEVVRGLRRLESLAAIAARHALANPLEASRDEAAIGTRPAGWFGPRDRG